MESVDSMLRRFLSIVDGAFDAWDPSHLDMSLNCTTTDASQLRRSEFRLCLCKWNGNEISGLFKANLWFRLTNHVWETLRHRRCRRQHSYCHRQCHLEIVPSEYWQLYHYRALSLCETSDSTKCDGISSNVCSNFRSMCFVDIFWFSYSKNTECNTHVCDQYTRCASMCRNVSKHHSTICRCGHSKWHNPCDIPLYRFDCPDNRVNLCNLDPLWIDKDKNNADGTRDFCSSRHFKLDFRNNISNWSVIFYFTFATWIQKSK